MSRRINGLTMEEWLVLWVDKEYPGKEFSRPDARGRSYAEMPRGYMPSIDLLSTQWFTKRFNDVLTRASFAFPEANHGRLVVRQEMLPWDEQSKLLIGKLRLVKTDRDAVRADLIAWASVNAPSMDIDRTMSELLKAAGL